MSENNETLRWDLPAPPGFVRLDDGSNPDPTVQRLRPIDLKDIASLATSTGAWKQLAIVLLETLDFQLRAEESDALKLAEVRRLVHARQPLAAHEAFLGCELESNATP